MWWMSDALEGVCFTLFSLFALWVRPSEGHSDWSDVWVVGSAQVVNIFLVGGVGRFGGESSTPVKLACAAHSVRKHIPSSTLTCQFFYLLCVSLSPALSVLFMFFPPSFSPSESQSGVLHRCPCPLHHAERFHVRQRVWGWGARPETGCLPQAALPKCSRLLLCKLLSHRQTREEGLGTQFHQFHSQKHLRRKPWSFSP